MRFSIVPKYFFKFSGGEGNGEEAIGVDAPVGNEEKAPDTNGQDDKAKSIGDGKEDEIDIDLDDPDLEKAATKIQAGFKGHRARKEVKENQTEKDEDSEGRIHEPEVGKESMEAQANKDQDGIDRKDEAQDHREQEHHDLGNKKAIEIQMPMQAMVDNGDEMELDLVEAADYCGWEEKKSRCRRKGASGSRGSERAGFPRPGR